MSRSTADERRRKTRTASESIAPQPPTLARGTRNSIQPLVVDDAEVTEDVQHPHEDSDTIVSGGLEEHDHLDLSSDADSIDAHMIALAKRRFGISAFRPG